jgi:two-component system, OmpR family, alkaline phosphatase synthesis response regulator PhoP
MKPDSNVRPTGMSAQPSVLVVEDDVHIVHVLRFMLERQGYRVIHVADGRAAVQHVVSQPAPDLVLLDVMLPYVDGFEIVALIRAQAGWKAVPVLMLTAKNTERDAVRGLDAGADDFIIKPFQPQELLARLRRFLKTVA